MIFTKREGFVSLSCLLIFLGLAIEPKTYLVWAHSRAIAPALQVEFAKIKQNNKTTCVRQFIWLFLAFILQCSCILELQYLLQYFNIEIFTSIFTSIFQIRISFLCQWYLCRTSMCMCVCLYACVCIIEVIDFTVLGMQQVYST